ncbi:MAG: hypothetical protein LBQ00_03290 [Syntrophobacterales bacterium]|nr:hypothetical protein [Syntrophobacterales bacterium]
MIVDFDLHPGNGTQHNFYGNQESSIFQHASILVILAAGAWGKAWKERGEIIRAMCCSL